MRFCNGMAVVAGTGELLRLTRAKWLLASGRARLAPDGSIEMLNGTAHSEAVSRAPLAVSPSPWSGYSRIGLPNPAGIAHFRGLRMNGLAINRSAGL